MPRPPGGAASSGRWRRLLPSRAGAGAGAGAGAERFQVQGARTGAAARPHGEGTPPGRGLRPPALPWHRAPAPSRASLSLFPSPSLSPCPRVGARQPQGQARGAGVPWCWLCPRFGAAPSSPTDPAEPLPFCKSFFISVSKSPPL